MDAVQVYADPAEEGVYSSGIVNPLSVYVRTDGDSGKEAGSAPLDDREVYETYFWMYMLQLYGVLTVDYKVVVNYSVCLFNVLW